MSFSLFISWSSWKSAYVNDCLFSTDNQSTRKLGWQVSDDDNGTSKTALNEIFFVISLALHYTLKHYIRADIHDEVHKKN